MPSYRFTIDTEASDPEKARLNIRQGGGMTIGCDELSRDPNNVRSIIFYRRATTSTDTAGDFLPNTDSCQGDDGMCDDIAVALVSFGDGEELRACKTHVRDWTPGVEIDRNDLEDYMRRGVE